MTLENLPTASRRVAAALQAAGATGAADRIRELDDSTRTAADAAKALGCELGAIANSLVFDRDGEAILVMTSGRHRVDTDLLARGLGAQAIRKASPEQVRAATGQAIGGVSPVGHPAPVPTFVDAALADYDTLWAAAGTPNTVFPTTYAELLRLTGGREVTVAEA